MNKIVKSPFETLDISPDAPLEQIKQKYLELIRQFPPEKEPEKFAEIRYCYDLITKELFDNPIKHFTYLKPLNAINSLNRADEVKDKPGEMLSAFFEVPFDTVFELKEKIGTPEEILNQLGI